ncbi:MAG: TraB/GumN family protein [Acidobacteria bacterium]|nr:TraB/GumN family protein [Acidobacteriota bacterium]
MLKLIRRSLFLLSILAPMAFFPAGAARAASDGDRLFLWEVQSRTATVYLLGSIHFAKEDLYPMNPVIQDAFSRSSTLIVEVNLQDIDPSDVQKQFLQKGMYTDGKSLNTSLSEKAMRILSPFLEKREVQFQRIQMMKPWLLSITLGVMEIQRLGFDPNLGIDKYFLNLAAQQNKIVQGLETLESQVQMLAGFSKDLQEKLLIYTIRDIDKMAGIMEWIIDAWSQGDTGAMEEIIFDPQEMKGDMAPVYDKMFFERNEAMARKIAGYLSDGETSFVVVGAGHLVGDRSIVDLLRKDQKAGYKIRQLTSSTQAAVSP